MVVKEILEKIRSAYYEAHALDIDICFLDCLKEIEDTYANKDAPQA